MRCPSCQYDLTGLPEQHICPECGHPFDKVAMRQEEEPFARIGLPGRAPPLTIRKLAAIAHPASLALAVAGTAVSIGLTVFVPRVMHGCPSCPSACLCQHGRQSDLRSPTGIGGGQEGAAEAAAMLSLPVAFALLMLAGVLARRPEEVRRWLIVTAVCATMLLVGWGVALG